MSLEIKSPHRTKKLIRTISLDAEVDQEIKELITAHNLKSYSATVQWLLQWALQRINYPITVGSGDEG